MFTGIIQATGRVVSLQRKGRDARLKIDAGKLSLADSSVGDSIAVNGVCLTAVGLQENHFEADVSAETLSRTSLGELAPGAAVNLELAMLPSTRFGGHIVSGHVDGLATLQRVQQYGESVRMSFELPAELARYVAEKGSICIDGVSLTVNVVSANRFEVNLVPHTMQETILQNYQPGRRVNIEVDIIARYLERLLHYRSAGDSGHAEHDPMVKRIRDLFEEG
jgi:riboflavin synthase